MFSLILAMFKWLPTPLFMLVSAIFTIFSIFVAVALIKIFLSVLDFLAKVTSGLFGKVAGLFVG